MRILEIPFGMLEKGNQVFSMLYLKMAKNKMLFKTFNRLIKKSYFKIKTIKVLSSSLKISDKELLKILNKDSKKEAIQCFREREISKFFVESENRNKIMGIFKQEFPKRIKNIIRRANEIYEHTFDLLGSGKANLGKKINWHCDFKSGYRWNPKTFYLDIKYGDREDVDVKIPWELSRFQHLATLGEAYWLTEDEKYTKEFIDEIEDWIENNPPQYGVNWKCTMDVAIRACNWILGYYFFKNSEEITDKFLIKLLKSLFIHGKHIERNLEKSWRGLTSNHYLSDITGLVYLGIFFKDTKQGQKWLKFGIKELKKEMQKQVYPDGCDFEASTCYHRLVLELFFFSTLFIVINDKAFNNENYREITEKIFGKEYAERLYKMFEAVLYLLKPNGKMPQIGDNDNGRLHIFVDREILNMRYLLTFGAIFFRESKFRVKEFGFSEEALWIFGENGYKIWRNLKENNLSNIKSKSFSNTGWYVMRNNKGYCMISCGPNGQNGNGGHCHNDKLSFELMVDGKDIIVDPGTYIYTPYPKWRNQFRSTAFHNTVVVDSQEQNRFIQNNLFSLKDNTKCRHLDFGEDDKKIWFEGEHYGYKRLKNPVIHRRQIIFNKKENYLIIKDILTSKGKHKLDWNFVLGLNISKSDIILGSKKIRFKHGINYYSSGYGKKVEIKKMTGSFKSRNNDSFEIQIKIK